MHIWKDYSLGYIKNNKATVVTILTAAFIASLLLSLICGVFYNIRADEIMLISLEEGDWQGRLIGNITSENVKILEHYPNVKNVVLSKDLETQENTASLYFYNARSIYKDLPWIAEQFSLKTDTKPLTVLYHEKLLEQYFIFSQEEGYKPPLVLFAYLFILLASCLSLILIIHNAFGVSMNARLHQLGILKSIGASPKQLRRVLIQEALFCCLVPVLAGVGSGTLLCRLFMQLMYHAVESVREYELQFHYHPFIFFGALMISLLTVWISALIPAVKLSRLEPLSAIRYGSEEPIFRIKHFFLLSRLFGIEGELARKSLYNRRKAFRTSTLSLTLSFLVFCSFLNLETISSISTTYTFFERYKNNWDLRITVTDQMKSRDELLKEIRNLNGVKDCAAYQKASAKAYITAEMLSEDLQSLGGLLQLNEQGITTDNNGAFIPVPLLRFATESFLNYCREIQTDPVLLTEGGSPDALAVNTIWDNRNSNRRNRKMIPFLNLKQVPYLTLLYDSAFVLWEDNRQTKVQTKENRKPAPDVTVSISTQTDKFPALREEYPDFSLLLVLPDTDTAADKLDAYFMDSVSYFSIKAVSEERIPDISKNLKNLLGGNYEYILEDRTELERTNVSIRNAYKVVIGSLAALLVCIGLANVFSNTYGHIYQRRREFARYISVGLSPKGVAKVLASEALILGFKPVLTGLLINIPLVYFALKASLIPLQDFLQQLPVLPVSLFVLVILSGVGFAYYTGGRKFYKMDLIDALKQDSLS